MYRYTGCGLPNVYLKNGYVVEETPYGKGVSIKDLDGLHDALGKAIVDSPLPLRGYEFRFLRTELELSQGALGDLLGCDDQAVARWEKGKSKQVNAPAERLLRRLYLECKAGGKLLAPLVDQLRKLESVPPNEHRKFVVSERGNTWKAREEALEA